MFATHDLSGYTRFPYRLKLMKPELSALEKPDVFGVEDRLLAVRENWPNDQVNTAIDLGGNSGFFSLSLIDEGLISHSTIYDTDVRSLEAGERMASIMGLSNKVRFVEQEASLGWFLDHDPVDLVINLNLIHHGGTLFDIDAVRESGWGDYAHAWLSQTRRIAKFHVFGVGFKAQKPVNWDVQTEDRPHAMIDMATAAGWKVSYEANVQDIADYGVERANGLRTILPIDNAARNSMLRTKASFLFRKTIRKANLSGSGELHSKRSKYHLFVLE